VELLVTHFKCFFKFIFHVLNYTIFSDLCQRLISEEVYYILDIFILIV